MNKHKNKQICLKIGLIGTLGSNPNPALSPYKGLHVRNMPANTLDWGLNIWVGPWALQLLTTLGIIIKNGLKMQKKQ